MPSYVLQDQATLKFLQKTDAWGHTLTDDLQKARIYITEKDARRTATNRPSYAKGEMPAFKIKSIKIVLDE
jgi:hypothetical protein